MALCGVLGHEVSSTTGLHHLRGPFRTFKAVKNKFNVCIMQDVPPFRPTCHVSHYNVLLYGPKGTGIPTQRCFVQSIFHPKTSYNSLFTPNV